MLDRLRKSAAALLAILMGWYREFAGLVGASVDSGTSRAKPVPALVGVTSLQTGTGTTAIGYRGPASLIREALPEYVLSTGVLCRYRYLDPNTGILWHTTIYANGESWEEYGNPLLNSQFANDLSVIN